MNGIKIHHEQFYVLGPFQCLGSFDALFNMGLALFQELTIDTYSDPIPIICLLLALIVLGLQKRQSCLSNKTFSQSEIPPVTFRETSGKRLEFYTTFMRALGDVAEHEN